MKKREDLVTRLYFIQRTFLQQFVLIYFPLLIIMNKTVGLDGIIWSQAVAATFSGETSSPDWLQPICEASHHRATALIGNTQPR